MFVSKENENYILKQKSPGFPGDLEIKCVLSVVAMLTIVDFKLFGVIGYAVSVIVILDGSADSFLCKDGAVYLLGGQTVKRIHDCLI